MKWPDDIANVSLQDWLTHIVSTFPITTCRIVVCALWFIWSTRNMLIHDKVIILSQDILKRVESYIKEVDAIQ